MVRDDLEAQGTRLIRAAGGGLPGYPCVDPKLLQRRARWRGEVSLEGMFKKHVGEIEALPDVLVTRAEEVLFNAHFSRLMHVLVNGALDGGQAEIVKLIGQGYTQEQAARELGMKQQRVSERWREAVVVLRRELELSPEVIMHMELRKLFTLRSNWPAILKHLSDGFAPGGA